MARGLSSHGVFFMQKGLISGNNNFHRLNGTRPYIYFFFWIYHICMLLLCCVVSYSQRQHRATRAAPTHNNDDTNRGRGQRPYPPPQLACRGGPTAQGGNPGYPRDPDTRPLRRATGRRRLVSTRGTTPCPPQQGPKASQARAG